MSWSDLPPLNALVPFEATVRLGSLTKAAAELHVTHGAISRQLRSLERSLGVELFHREGRTLVATEQAKIFCGCVTDALGGLSAAVRQARPTSAQAPLVLSCEPTLMMRWLLPRMPSLSLDRPEIDLHLSAAGGPIDFQRAAVDVAIRRNDFEIDASQHAQSLFAEWIGPVCAPEVAAHLRQPWDLVDAPRLTSATRPSAWETWARLHDVALPDVQTRVLEHFYVSLEAASAGLGVAIGPYPLVKNDIQAGRLVAPLGFVEDGTKYVLLSKRGTRDPRVEQLSIWLRNQERDSVPDVAHWDRSTSGEP